MMVKVEFDPKKDEANREKHGVSLELADELDWNTMMVQAMTPRTTAKIAGSASHRRMTDSTQPCTPFPAMRPCA
jgi:uncharacterized DUF497 family protein